MTNLLNAEHIIAKIVFTAETVVGTASQPKCLADFSAAERILAKIQSFTLVLTLKGHLDGKSQNVQGGHPAQLPHFRSSYMGHFPSWALSK